VAIVALTAVPTRAEEVTCATLAPLGHSDRVPDGRDLTGRHQRLAQCWNLESWTLGLEPPSGIEFVQLSAGYSHVCGVRASDGQVLCWGGYRY
jgi:hypothetical protein